MDAHQIRNQDMSTDTGQHTDVLAEGVSGHTAGDYPNAANIQEWMRLYFGRDAMDTDLRFTFWHVRGGLPSISTVDDAIRFGLAKGYRITDAGRAKAYELGILSDDSPAVPIPKGAATPTGDTDKATRGRPKPSAETRRRDNEIYRRHKRGGESYNEIAEYFDMSRRDVVKAFDRQRKRESRRD